MKSQQKADGGTTAGQKRQSEGPAGPRGRGRGAKKPRAMLTTLRRLMDYLRPHWLATAGVLAAVVISTGLGLLPPWMIRYGVDELILEGRPEGLWVLGLLMVAVALLQGLMDFLTRYGSEFVSQSVIHDIRSQLYEHLNRLSFAFYDWSRTGDIMARVTSDADALRRFFSNACVYISRNLLTILGVFVVMMTWEPRLALLYLLMLPLMVHAMATYAGKVRPMFSRVRRQLAQLTRMLQEDLVGMEVIKLFGAEQREQQQFEEENAEYVAVNVSAARVTALWMPYVSFLLGAATALVIWYGGRLVISGVISVGTLMGFSGYIAMLMRPIRQTGMMMSFSAQAVAAGERIFDVMDIEPDITDAPDAYPLPSVEGQVQYRGVEFSYQPGNPVLSGIDFSARPGETVAVVGPTGAGKSTLIHLLPRFYDPDAGQILIDGHDIAGVEIESLRSQIGIVLQHTFLFAASIRENISYGRPDASFAEVVRCAKIAQIHDFVDSLPLGYETPVGERGVTLSGGQKQRLAMARVLLTDPNLLILDEPTSSVDAETEQRMQKALSAVMEGRTTFVIAHRLWTVRNADRIVVLKDGTIAEMGTHEELAQADGFYQEVYQTVLRPDGEDMEAGDGQ